MKVRQMVINFFIDPPFKNLKLLYTLFGIYKKKRDFEGMFQKFPSLKKYELLDS